jgi:hypothetical protein
MVKDFESFITNDKNFSEYKQSKLIIDPYMVPNKVVSNEICI